ncbi:hypothetical protein CW748_13715 [Alteromonadales bacterium alter-6D02]|nr:hypothetical protein CW748_13715 [Alteromonadales bacterium alter-6D02]
MIRKSIIAAALTITCALPNMAYAKSSHDLKPQFDVAYQNYKKAIASDSAEQQIKFAKEAYELGGKIYNKTGTDYANLAINLGAVYNSKEQFAQANEVLLPILAIYESEYPADAKEWVALYFELADSMPWEERKKKVSYFRKAVKVAKNFKKESPVYYAQIQLEVGIKLLHVRPKDSKMILSALEVFQEHLEPNDTRVIRANFHAGKYYQTRNRKSKAISYFESNLPIFETLEGPTHPYELMTRAFLIQMLESKGETDKATEHCIAIGAMKPWSDAQEQTPLFRTKPRLSKKIVTRGASYTIIKFTITESGMVENPIVTESGGNSRFDKASIAAVKRWRYAPKFENGKPVAATSRVKISFETS